MSASAQVHTAIDSAEQAIGAASALVARGDVVDLSGLDRTVETLCRDIAALPQGERQGLKPKLVALIDGLNRLVGQIQAQHREISAALGGLGARRNAVNAYGKGAGAGKPPGNTSGGG